MAIVNIKVWDDDCYETNFDTCKAIFDRTYETKGSAEEAYQRAIEYGNAIFEPSGSAAQAEINAKRHMNELVEWSNISTSSQLK